MSRVNSSNRKIDICKRYWQDKFNIELTNKQLEAITEIVTMSDKLLLLSNQNELIEIDTIFAINNLITLFSPLIFFINKNTVLTKVLELADNYRKNFKAMYANEKSYMEMRTILEYLAKEINKLLK